MHPGSSRAERRRLLWELAQRAVQVFVASLLVELAEGNLVPSLHRIEFWQDVAGAAIVAALSQLFSLLAIQAAHHERDG